MAAIDSLLKLIAARGADELTLVAGGIPELAKAGARLPLSMPPLDAAFLEQLLAEVAPDVQGCADDGERNLPYDVDGSAFTIRVGRRGGVLRLSARPGGGRGVRGGDASAGSAGHAALRPTRREAPRAHVATTPTPTPTPTPGPTSVAMPAVDPVELAHLHSGFDELLHEVERRGASDVFLSSGRPARLRVGAELVELQQAFDEAEILALVGQTLDAGGLESLRERGSIDATLDRREVGGLRFRINVFRQHGGVAAALRPIRRDAPTLEQLRLPADFTALVAHRHGMVLMAGPAGSGKSTTLAALIEHVNRTRARHVITLEDPIEYEYVSKRALIHQREVGRDVRSFAEGLRAALRESPDVILVGEMRDAETIAAALTAAETGHLVLSTLHAPSGPDAVDRIIDSFAPHQQRQVRGQLASILRAVVTQHLVPSTIAAGRVAVFEKMFVNRAIAAMIREDKCHQIGSQLQTGRDQGMLSLDQCLAEKLAAGAITRETALELAEDRDLVMQQARGRAR